MSLRLKLTTSLFIIFILFFRLPALKVNIKKAYQYLKFIPLNDSEEVQLINDDDSFFMQRTGIVHNMYFHLITYTPEDVGLVYYIDSSDSVVYFDFIGPEFPLVYYFNIDEKDDLINTCTFADFVNDETHEMELNSFEEIQDYFASFEFTQNSWSEYIENGISHQFNYSDYEQEPIIGFEAITTDFRNVFFRQARESVKNLKFDLPKFNEFALYFKLEVLKKFNKLFSTLESKMADQASIDNFQNVIAKINIKLESIFEKVALICEPVVDDMDPLKREKQALILAFSSHYSHLFQNTLDEFDGLMEEDIPLTAAIYFKAKFKSHINRSTGFLNGWLSAANVSFEKNSDFDVNFFVNSISTLNLRILKFVFFEVNDAWKSNLANLYLQQFDQEIRQIMADLLDEDLQTLQLKEDGTDLLDGFDFDSFYDDYLIDSHPYFNAFHEKFSEIINQKFYEFYFQESEFIQNLKKTSSDPLTGGRALTNRLYWVNLKSSESPNYWNQKQMENDFFDTYMRLLI